jgi:SAM-dependent methyltransferase
MQFLDSPAKATLSPEKLPVLGAISNPDKDIFGTFADLEGKKLLCIGFSEAEVDELVAPYNPRQICLLTKWSDHQDAVVDKYELIIGDITQRTHLPDSSFDAVLTLSVLEHLENLQAAFDEMSRIVKAKGEQVHFFGPVWSSAYGHHLYANAHDQNLNFCSWSMPAHMHLLCDHASIKEYYNTLGYESAVADTVLHWFYKTDIINREPFDSYLSIFNEARFQITRLEVMANKLPDEHLKLLRSRHANITDFSTYGAKVALINNKR